MWDVVGVFFKRWPACGVGRGALRADVCWGGRGVPGGLDGTSMRGGAWGGRGRRREREEGGGGAVA